MQAVARALGPASAPHRPGAGGQKAYLWPFFPRPSSSAHLEPQSLLLFLDLEGMRMPLEIREGPADFPLKDIRGLDPRLVTGRGLNESQGRQ